MEKITKSEVAGYYAYITAFYPNAKFDVSAEQWVNAWYMMLSRFDKRDVAAAFGEHFRNGKYPPSIGDICGIIERKRRAGSASPEELWDILLDSIRRASYEASAFEYTGFGEDGRTQGEAARDAVHQIWKSLPTELREYFSKEKSFTYLAMTYTDSGLEFEKTRFFKAIPRIAERMRDKGVALTESKITQLGDGK